MVDLFEWEQRIYDSALNHVSEIKNGVPCDPKEFEILANEYGRLLLLMRRFTKISDRTTVELNTSRLDLLDKMQYDALTGIYNRWFMEGALKRTIKSLSRSGGTLSMLMIDIDFFKKYNDTYGHSMGDDCLKSIAQAVKTSITRNDDFAVRYGGEEFTIVLPNTNESGARLIANKLLQNVRTLNIPHEKSDVASCVTVSIGVTTGGVKHTQRGNDYIMRADEALYMSKQNGRNQYTFLKFKEEAK